MTSPPGSYTPSINFCRTKLGSLGCSFQMKPANSRHNYTRSYYMNGGIFGPSNLASVFLSSLDLFCSPLQGEYIVSGSCEETAIRLYNAVTGKFLRDVELGHLSSEHLCKFFVVLPHCYLFHAFIAQITSCKIASPFEGIHSMTFISRFLWLAIPHQHHRKL